MAKTQPAMTTIRVGLLASGKLGLDAIATAGANSTVNFVMTDGRSTDILAYCDEKKIPVFSGNPRTTNANQFLSAFNTDVLLSVNYLFIVNEDVLKHPYKLAVNIHGSLLPKYRGRTPHVWAIINNETETGVTAHIMDKGCDTGDILLQHRIPISKTATGADVLDAFKPIYAEMIAEVLRRSVSNSWTRTKQDESKATYFHRRRPEDGRICWSWQRERIYNWIRAQARPYPGAFFVYKDKQYRVHQSRFSDCGFDGARPNGTVLRISPLTVKTPNGAIALVDHEHVQLSDPVMSVLE